MKQILDATKDALNSNGRTESIANLIQSIKSGNLDFQTRHQLSIWYLTLGHASRVLSILGHEKTLVELDLVTDPGNLNFNYDWVICILS